MQFRICILDNDILGECNGSTLRIALSDEILSTLRKWKRRYQRALRTCGLGILPGLGAEMFDWLDSSGWKSGDIPN